LVRRFRWQAACGVDFRRRVLCRKFVLSGAARHHADSDVARAAGARITLASVAGGLLGYFIGAVLYDTVGAWLIYGYGDKVEAFRTAYAQLAA
jgi:hypothetical protein